MSPTTAVSAPGKVFLAGGYLVLDRAYTALVFGLSARIHILVEDVVVAENVNSDAHPEIVVQSPQFRDATWNYGCRPATDNQNGGILVAQLQGASRNPFVETTLTYALTYISTITASTLKPTKITILADNDYYSQQSSSPCTVSARFADFGVSLSSAHKTGLGSSAALVTSLTAAILTHYLPASQFTIASAAGKSILHNLAQASHCAAQGKVGSGFDVAVAVYGTCKYRRFSPSILSALGDVGSFDFASRVKGVVENVGLEKEWDTECEKGLVTIPKGMALVMCDVDCGSHTPSMVKKVLEWRKADPVGSKELMDKLQACNDVLELKLAQGDMQEMTEAFGDIRAKIREMGDRSGVPIEPVEQTELLDAVTKEVEGVAGGVVPGAGGYDAIVLLVRDDEETMRKLGQFLERWSMVKGSVKLLKTKGELDGARVENVDTY